MNFDVLSKAAHINLEVDFFGTVVHDRLVKCLCYSKLALATLMKALRMPAWSSIERTNSLELKNLKSLKTYLTEITGLTTSTSDFSDSEDDSWSQCFAGVCRASDAMDPPAICDTSIINRRLVNDKSGELFLQLHMIYLNVTCYWVRSSGDARL